MDDFDVRDVMRSTSVLFPNGGKVLANFCYLHLLVKTFGHDLRLAIGQCADVNNPMLYMKTADDRFYGALMPLRSYGDTYEVNFILHAEEVA